MELDKKILEYSPVVSQLWRTALDQLSQIEEYQVGMITFGSLVTGDFTCALHKKKSYLLSDFELSILTQKPPTKRCQDDYLSIARKFNSEFSRNHLGFHLNLKVEAYNEFQSRLTNNAYLFNTIARSGIILKWNTDFMLPINRDAVAVSPSTCIDVMDSVVVNLLIQQNQRMISIKELYPLYSSILIAKFTGKLARLISCLGRNYVSTAKESITFIQNQIPESVLASILMAEDFRTRANYSNNLEFSLINGAVVVMSYMENMMYKYGFDKNKQEFNLLKELFSNLSSCGTDENLWNTQYNLERDAFVLPWLRGKGTHYDYYKQAYGVI